MMIMELQMTEAQRAKVIGNLSSAAAMIGEVAGMFGGAGAVPLVIPLVQAGKVCASLAEVFIAAQPAKPKEHTMATAIKKPTTKTAKKASKPLGKALKAVKAMKPTKKAAKKVAK